MIMVVIPGSKREGTSWRLVLRNCETLLDESQKGKDEEGMHLENFEDRCLAPHRWDLEGREDVKESEF